MYAVSQPTSAPVHTFGTGAGTGPPTFGTAGPAGPKSFTGGGVPLSAPPGDMGNVLTHKQSARVVVDKSVHIGDYESQCKTLVEKEFSVIQLNCRNDLHSSTPPGENAVISSLAQSNWTEMHREQLKTHKRADGHEDMLQHLNSAKYAPFGPVIQTDRSSKKRFGSEKTCVTNVAVGGRANFANCFIRTAGSDGHSATAPINVGDGVFMASFLFTCDDNGVGANAAYRTFNFLIVDNDYSMVPKVPAIRLTVSNDNNQADEAAALQRFIEGCMDGVDKSAKLCQTLCCAFENPGIEIRNAGRCENKHIRILCTAISCVGVIIECPIPNVHVEHPQRILQGMISNKATMSTTHPVAVQMTS